MKSIRRLVRDVYKHPRTKTALAYFQIARGKYKRFGVLMLIVSPLLLLLVSPILLLIVPFAIPLIVILGMGLMAVGMMSAAMIMTTVCVVLFAGLCLPIPVLGVGVVVLLGLGYKYVTSAKNQLEENKYRRKFKERPTSARPLQRSHSDVILSKRAEQKEEGQQIAGPAPGFEWLSADTNTKHSDATRRNVEEQARRDAKEQARRGAKEEAEEQARREAKEEARQEVEEQAGTEVEQANPEVQDANVGEIRVGQIHRVSNAAADIQHTEVSEEAVVFAVNSRYESLALVGTGRFGMVCSAHDRCGGREVAIKRIGDVFIKADLARQAVRETLLLRLLGAHPNIVQLLAVQMPVMEGSNSGSEFYLVMGRKDGTLGSLLKRSGGKLAEVDVQYLAAQLMCGLRWIHSCNTMHRDIKPENLLVDEGSLQLQIADFGIACVSRTAAQLPQAPADDAAGGAAGGALTEYIGTRFYRAPEVVIGFKSGYTSAIDVWAAGCVIAEMMGGALFHNCTRRNHLLRISRVCALPTVGPELEAMVSSKKSFKAIKQLPKSKPVAMGQLFPDACTAAVDLLTELLQFMPCDRASAQDALQHPFLAGKLGQHQQPQLQDLSASSEFEYEQQELSLSDYTALIRKEVSSYAAAPHA
jgi:serine/threonine protein kinase